MDSLISDRTKEFWLELLNRDSWIEIFESPKLILIKFESVRSSRSWIVFYDTIAADRLMI